MGIGVAIHRLFDFPNNPIEFLYHVTYYLFPKAVGLFERGWNAAPAWAETTQPDDPAFVNDFDKFFTIVAEREYPYYANMGISWHTH